MAIVASTARVSAGAPADLLAGARRALGRRGVVPGAQVVAFFVLPLLYAFLFPKSIPPGLLLQGYVLGGLYGLLGVGLILVYRTNRIISFAQASLGSVPAVTGLYLMSNRGVPYLVVVPIVIMGSLALGALVEVLLRRFATAPRLIFTVATIGVGLLLAFIEFNIPKLVGGVDTGAASFPTPFSRFQITVAEVTKIKGDYLVAFVVTMVAVLGVAAFFRFTDIGLAARASAENAERANLLGIPVRQVSLVVWMLASLLSGIAIFLQGPLIGVAAGGNAGPAVLIFGLAAAVIGKMESTPTAFGAGAALGMLVQVMAFKTGKSSVASGLLLVVILVALLLQRQSLSRAKDTGVATWQAAKEYRGIPSELAGVREVVVARQGLWALIGLVALAAPLVLSADAGRLAIVCCYAIAAVSVVVLTGWAGQISLGQFGFAGVGGLVTAHLASNQGWDMFTVLLCAGLFGALTAVLVGLPALRIQGLFLAVTTLAFAFTVQNVVLNKDYTGRFLIQDQLQGIERPALYGRLDLTPENRFYYLCLFFLVLALAGASCLRKSRSGRVLLATRDNGRVAQAFGVNVARTRLAAFAFSGFLAAISGSLLCYQLGTVDEQTFTPLVSISLLAAVVIGGTTSLPGSVLGTLWVFGIPLLLEKHLPGIGFLAGGAGLLVLLLVLPGGLAELIYRTRDSLLRTVADRHGIVVPSLVADVRSTAEPAAPLAEAADEAAAHEVHQRTPNHAEVLA